MNEKQLERIIKILVVLLIIFGLLYITNTFYLLWIISQQ